MSVVNYNRKIVLASGSPRRKELLGLCVDEFEVRVLDVDESCDCADPAEYVKTLAERKARATANALPDCAVIGADTVVVLDGEILGKPRDKDDAVRMLTRLSGRSHYVYTGIAVICGGRSLVRSCETKVWVAAMTPSQTEAYINTGESMDKAGAYGVQGLFAPFIERLDGCYYNVMGLPLNTLQNMLTELCGAENPK